MAAARRGSSSGRSGRDVGPASYRIGEPPLPVPSRRRRPGDGLGQPPDMPGVALPSEAMAASTARQPNGPGQDQVEASRRRTRRRQAAVVDEAARHPTTPCGPWSKTSRPEPPSEQPRMVAWAPGWPMAIRRRRHACWAAGRWRQTGGCGHQVVQVALHVAAIVQADGRLIPA